MLDAQDKVPWPIRILAYVFPYSWEFRTLNYLEFSDSRWEGAVACPPGYNLSDFYSSCAAGTRCMGAAQSSGLFCCPGKQAREW